MTNTQKIISLIKENKWNSIFFSFLKKIFVFMLIPFTVIFVITYAFFTNSLENDFAKLIGSSLQKNCSSISNILTICDNHYLDLAFSNQILNLLSDDFLEKPSEVEQNISYFNKNNTKILHTTPNIKNIILYNKLNDHVLSKSFSGYTERFENKEWFTNYKASEDNGKNIFMLPYSKDSFLRCYKIFEGKKYLGCLMFEIDPDMSNTIDNNNGSILDNITLIDKDGFVFYNSSEDQSIINDKFVEEAFSKETLLEKRGNCFVYSQRSQSSDYIVISVSNKSHVAGTTAKLNIFFFGIVLMLILLLLMISVYLSGYVYNSISRITVLLQDLPDTESKDSNEIYYITQQILSVVNDRNSIEKELTDKINQLKKLQITALNTQISPHFVFNTLNLINAIIMNIVKKPNDAEKVVGILADSFYYSLKNENYIVSIEDELYYTKKFIEIEHIKLEGNFDVYYDIEPGIEKYKALKFMLQPLVENSFTHGITKQHERKGRIVIRIFKESGKLICKVYDNGNKIDESKLAELNYKLKLEWNTADNEHIGLNNINSRIRLLWGEEYGCTIDSDNNGTTITTIIPLMGQ